MKIAVAGGTGVVGHYVVESAERRGHEVVTLSRAASVDLLTASAASLASALHGVDVVIDVSSVQTQSAKKSEHFFGTVTERMLAAEKIAGVGHHIALSIVGSDKAPYGYYAGKALQERMVTEGSIPWTILRATQFHEFASQIFGQAAFGPIHVVPKMFSQPIAAREVANRLVELAENAPAGRPADLAGPEGLRMVDMVKAYVAATHATGTILEVPLPGGFGTALRNRTLIPDSSAQLGTQKYSEWLAQL